MELDTLSFPDDFWSVVRPLLSSDHARQTLELADEVEEYFGGPRDIGIARQFIRNHLPPGRIYVYGAGLHSENIVDILTHRDDLDVLGFLDRDADRLKTFHGYEVLAPERIVELDFDYVLISYQRIEATMVDRLRQLGVPAAKIHTIYSDPGFIATAVAEQFSRIERRLDGRRFDHVIVRSGIHEVVPDSVLVELFPPETTLVIHIGPAKPTVAISPFWTIDAQGCAALAARIVKALRPKTVYLSTAQEFELFYFPIRRAVPDTQLIHEIYDFFPLIPEDWIKLGINASDRLIELMRLSNYFSCRYSQMIVSKRAGREWNRACESFYSPYLFVYPGIGSKGSVDWDESTRESPGDGPVHILYAGAQVPPHFHIYMRSDYNFLPLMEEITQKSNVTIDIFNSSHAYEMNDSTFRNYMERYPSPPMTYHRRIPFDNLIHRMQKYHFGWLCLPPREQDLADQQVVICNRFSAYVYGGLPTIVDAEWHFIADLVAEYGAGLVVEDADPDKVLRAIRECDYQALLRGTVRLREHMWRHNEMTKESLCQLVDKAGNNPSREMTL